ncbi:MAG: hypothetical protein ACREJM_11760, partial [Candidatus Saccharimonadales bacterium]
AGTVNRAKCLRKQRPSARFGRLIAHTAFESPDLALGYCTGMYGRFRVSDLRIAIFKAGA